MFLTYLEYIGMGGTLNQSEFDRLCYKAESRVNLMTHNRIRDETPVRECVKRCVFELIGLIHKELAVLDTGTGIQSMNNDGVSVSYADKTSVRKAYTTLMNEAMVDYLGNETKDGVPLLYAGVSV